MPLSAHADEILAIGVEQSKETITLNLHKTSPHKVFTIQHPDRLVVDVPMIPGKQRPALPDSYDGDLIKSVRYGQFDPHTSRFVFDLAQPVRINNVDERDGRLIVTIEPGEPDNDTDKFSTPQQPQKSITRETKSAPKAGRKYTRPIIVIDAGHGGQDPGTIGPGRTQEKDITLRYASTLKARLLKTGRYQVKLTRGDDNFIMLRRRVAIARAAHADLFISLHADSSPDDARGLSVYTVSEKASDQETEALAARENKSDILAGVDLSDEQQDVADILISLAQRETMNRSAVLADVLVRSMQDRVKLLPNTHRFAGFAVLKAPDVPSVLIEIGFLSHPGEEKLLKSKAYRDKVVEGIAAGVDAYFVQLRRMEGQ